MLKRIYSICIYCSFCFLVSIRATDIEESFALHYVGLIFRIRAEVGVFKLTSEVTFMKSHEIPACFRFSGQSNHLLLACGVASHLDTALDFRFHLCSFSYFSIGSSTCCCSVLLSFISAMLQLDFCSTSDWNCRKSVSLPLLPTSRSSKVPSRVLRLDDSSKVHSVRLRCYCVVLVEDEAIHSQ